jgi:hypothetical protein
MGGYRSTWSYAARRTLKSCSTAKLELRIYLSADWDKRGTEADPLAAMDQREAGYIAWFVKYRVGEDKLQPGYHKPGLRIRLLIRGIQRNHGEHTEYAGIRGGGERGGFDR